MTIIEIFTFCCKVNIVQEDEVMFHHLYKPQKTVKRLQHAIDRDWKVRGSVWHFGYLLWTVLVGVDDVKSHHTHCWTASISTDGKHVKFLHSWREDDLDSFS